MLHRIKAQHYQIGIFTFLVTTILAATIYTHIILKTDLIISHSFYIPILLAAYWWKRWGIIVSVSFGVFIIIAQLLFLSENILFVSMLRAMSFTAVGLMAYWGRIRIDAMKDRFRKTHSELIKILNLSSTGMLILDDKCNVLRVNNSLIKMLNIPEKKLRSLPLKCHDLLNAPFGNCNFCPMNYIKNGRVFPDKDVTLKDMDGNDVECIVRTRPLSTTDQKITHTLVDVINITERKINERKLSDYQKQLRSLASELSLAEERERRRLATNLHDSVCQTLFITKMKLGVLKTEPSMMESNYLDEISQIYQNVNQALNETRTLMLELSPPILYELGLEAAIEWLVDHMKRHDDIAFSYDDDGVIENISDNIKVLLFQSVRELLNNIIKHASAKNVKIKTTKGEHYIRIEVEDDGVGFNIDVDHLPANVEAGFGLFNIKERLNHFEGTLQIETQRGHGSKIIVIAPYGDILQGMEK